jgi:hypothetical protein
VIDTNPDINDINDWISEIKSEQMKSYKPGQSGAYGGGYHPNAAGHGGGYR